MSATILGVSVVNVQSAGNDIIVNDDVQLVNSGVQVSIDVDAENVVHDLEPQNDANDLRELQRAGQTLKSSFDLAATDKRNLYVRMFDSLLCRKDHVSGLNGHHLVLLVQKRKEAIKLAYDTIWGGHLFAKSCLQGLKMSFWWPNITYDVREYCGS